MRNSARDLLHSLPIDVEFAGFRGNTLALAKAGWDLSMQQEHSAWGRYLMRLAMRHSGAGLYALSNPIELDYGSIGAALENGVEYAKLLAHLCFSIAHIHPEIRIATQVERGMGGRSFAGTFEAIDPFPQERIVEESLKDFKFFKVSNPSIQDIIVGPEHVPELLDMVLKAQKPMLDKVRARERSRANTEWVRGEMRGSTKPAHHVQAQIITLASCA